MIKGKNQHVIPQNGEWYVLDENEQCITHAFPNQREAIAYAKARTLQNDGDVLIHLHPSPMHPFSYKQHPLHQGTSSKMSHCHSVFYPKRPRSDFDPLLGYDEYYFEI